MSTMSQTSSAASSAAICSTGGVPTRIRSMPGAGAVVAIERERRLVAQPAGQGGAGGSAWRGAT